jgi:hypothetical protein
LLIAVGCLTLLALAQAGLLFQQAQAFREERAQNLVERRELYERIQRPERIPASVGPAEYVAPEQQPDEWNLVGTINHEPVEEQQVG